MKEKYLADGSVEITIKQFNFCKVFETIEEGRAEAEKLFENKN